MTVLVLGYKQEQFIESAVASAFAQTADNLEIILSDDASPDGTFAVMEEMVARYDGPHRVICQRNAQNLGTNAHINHLVEQAGSTKVMCIAGDDISRPDRAAVLLRVFQEDAPLLIHSDADSIDENDQPGDRRAFEFALFFKTAKPEEAWESFSLYLGATVAFDKDLFVKYGPLPVSPAYEDLILGFRAAMEHRVAYVPEKLIKYRVGVGVSAVETPTGDLAIHTRKRRKTLALQVAVLEQRLKDARTFYGTLDKPIPQRIVEFLEDRRHRLAYHEHGKLKAPVPFWSRLRIAHSERRRLRNAVRYHSDLPASANHPDTRSSGYPR